MRAWLGGVAIAALIAGGVPALAQTTGPGTAPAATQSKAGEGTSAAPSAMRSHDRMQKKSGARHARKRGSGAAHRQAMNSDNAATEQLNREELQRAQQSSR